MRFTDAEDLAKFVEELKLETDRGLPLVGAALIDDRLQETLRSFFCEGRTSSKLLDSANAPLGTFSSRVQACYSLGLIDEREYAEIELIRKVRNEFAHAKHGTSFRTEKLKGLCSSLRSDLPEGENYPTDDPKFRFMNAVVSIVLRLYYRPEWVALERRTPKTWLSEDATRWRSIRDEKPPSDVPLIVVAQERRE
jgi:mannitol operon repressor